MAVVVSWVGTAAHPPVRVVLIHSKKLGDQFRIAVSQLLFRLFDCFTVYKYTASPRLRDGEADGTVRVGMYFHGVIAAKPIIPPWEGTEYRIAAVHSQTGADHIPLPELFGQRCAVRIAVRGKPGDKASSLLRHFQYKPAAFDGPFDGTVRLVRYCLPGVLGLQV